MWYGAMEAGTVFDEPEQEFECEIVEFNQERQRDRESLSAELYDEMDIWFRRAMASNGFGGI